MPYLILGLGVVIGLALILRGMGGVDPRRVARLLVLVIGILAVVAVIAFAAAHGIGALWIVLGLLLPAFVRWRATRQFFRNLGGPSPGQSSDVETRYLRMSLDHDSGVLNGTVLDGPFAGRRLGEMAPAELRSLLRECRIEDEQSAAVLEAYLDRVHGAAWRTEEADGGREDADAQGAGGGSRWGGGARRGGDAMSRDEAYEILGLEPGASEEEVRRAHHKMMQKAHPDHGGSNYLASKINQAKDLLLGR
ncbi:MAG: DnaJ domain-containing protein [Alphaproteobacteria bacterium]|nr:DnaJ domain-containing protein [Alphaproteobacteria bacterium]